MFFHYERMYSVTVLLFALLNFLFSFNHVQWKSWRWPSGLTRATLALFTSDSLTSFVNRLDQFLNLNAILSSFVDPRNLPQRIDNFQRATEIFTETEVVPQNLRA